MTRILFYPYVYGGQFTSLYLPFFYELNSTRLFSIVYSYYNTINICSNRKLRIICDLYALSVFFTNYNLKTG